MTITKTDPYAAPKAPVHDLHSAPERPVWVWVILALYLLGAIGGVTSVLLAFGVVDLPEEQRLLLSRASTFDHVITLSLVCLRLTAAIQLVRLKRISAYLFPAAFAVGVCYFLLRLATRGASSVVALGGITPQLIGWAVTIAICVYAWRLRQRGVLR